MTNNTEPVKFLGDSRQRHFNPCRQPFMQPSPGAPKGAGVLSGALKRLPACLPSFFSSLLFLVHAGWESLAGLWPTGK